MFNLVSKVCIVVVSVQYFCLTALRAGGEKKYLSGHISETVRCRKLILGRDIG